MAQNEIVVTIFFVFLFLWFGNFVSTRMLMGDIYKIVQTKYCATMYNVLVDDVEFKLPCNWLHIKIVYRALNINGNCRAFNNFFSSVVYFVVFFASFVWHVFPNVFVNSKMFGVSIQNDHSNHKSSKKSK